MATEEYNNTERPTKFEEQVASNFNIAHLYLIQRLADRNPEKREIIERIKPEIYQIDVNSRQNLLTLKQAMINSGYTLVDESVDPYLKFSVPEANNVDNYIMKLSSVRTDLNFDMEYLQLRTNPNENAPRVTIRGYVFSLPPDIRLFKFIETFGNKLRTLDPDCDTGSAILSTANLANNSRLDLKLNTDYGIFNIGILQRSLDAHRNLLDLDG